MDKKNKRKIVFPSAICFTFISHIDSLAAGYAGRTDAMFLHGILKAVQLASSIPFLISIGMLFYSFKSDNATLRPAAIKMLFLAVGMFVLLPAAVYAGFA